MVEAERKEILQAHIQAGTHAIVADVLPNLGGENTGPNPHELLESALAACTIITVQMYANRKAWPLRSTNVKVKIEVEGPQTQILREISFEGDLDGEQKTKLLEIANKCPIHKLLQSQITVITKTVSS